MNSETLRTEGADHIAHLELESNTHMEDFDRESKADIDLKYSESMGGTTHSRLQQMSTPGGPSSIFMLGDDGRALTAS